MFDFRLGEVATWIKGSGARTVAIQMPEGLKVHAQRIVEQLETETNTTCLIIGDPCYGACDVAVRFETFADLLVQFGHSEIPAMDRDPRVLFIEVFINIDVTELLEKALPLLKTRIGLLTTIQHVQMLPAIRAWLEAHGKEVLTGKGDSRIKFDGQVLGCNISTVDPIAEQAEQFIYIGSGDFHPLSVAIETDKPVLILDPMIREVRDIAELKERILRQRHAAIVRAGNAKRYVILVSTKVGQMRLDLALRLRALVEAHGKRAEIVLLEEFDPDYLLSFETDAYISTACPRIAVDDYLRYPKPIITPVEMEIALGLKKWADYRMDCILG